MRKKEKQRIKEIEKTLRELPENEYLPEEMERELVRLTTKAWSESRNRLNNILCVVALVVDIIGLLAILCLLPLKLLRILP